MKTQLTTKVSITRNVSGETAEEFAGLIGKSISTLRSLETNRLVLSEATAQAISHATGVSAKWLLSGAATSPLTADGSAFTAQTYAAHRLRVRNKERGADTSKVLLQVYLPCDLLRVIASVYAAFENGSAELAAHRVEKFANEMAKSFGGAKDENGVAGFAKIVGRKIASDSHNLKATESRPVIMEKLLHSAIRDEKLKKAVLLLKKKSQLAPSAPELVKPARRSRKRTKARS